MSHALFLLLGVLYGFVFGIIPVAGTATALIALFGFMSYFQHDPYALVIFTTAAVVSSSIGDSFSSVVLNIPGGGGSAATMVDGFPMAQRGEGARALSAATVTSAANGLIWGLLVFLFLPYYTVLIRSFGIPEMFAFTCLAMVTVVFVNSRYWFRGILALALGIFLGLVGTDPQTNAARFTAGWFYLADGIQLAPVMAGVLAFPELFEALRLRHETTKVRQGEHWHQMRQGIVDAWTYRWDSLRGGLIGGIIGMLPGIGGNIVDWLAYGQTVAMHPNDKIPFGQGNVRGVIGCEGANNSQKATAYLPTVLFGVPSAPFEAIIMALFMYVGLEMGSPLLLKDTRFFEALSYGYLWGLALTFVLAMLTIRYAIAITAIPLRYYVIPLVALITWSCVQYTGGWEDYVVLLLCTALGFALKAFKLSRAAFIIGFVLAERVESITGQYLTLYDPSALLFRPISFGLVVAALLAISYGLFFNKGKITYV